MEREAIGERTREALRHKRSKEQRVGNVAYGFRLADDGVHVEADPSEQAVLAEIRRLRGEGMPLRKIATTLNRRAYQTRPRTAWWLESVARVLKRDALVQAARAHECPSPIVADCLCHGVLSEG